MRHVIDCFGAQRVMWGSDWPVLNLNGDYDRWRATSEAVVKPAEREAIFGGTAAQFYRISP
jgi:L-fuconolactonase